MLEVNELTARYKSIVYRNNLLPQEEVNELRNSEETMWKALDGLRLRWYTIFGKFNQLDKEAKEKIKANRAGYPNF